MRFTHATRHYPLAINTAAHAMVESSLLGIDVGTTNVKVVLVEESSLRVLHKHSESLGEREEVEVPNAAERTVSQIFHALERCMRSLEGTSHRLELVRGIGVCGQMHGCVLWNSRGVPLFNESIGELQHSADTLSSNLITWQDTRCDPAFLSSLPRPCHLAKPPVSAGYGCASLAWLQHHDRNTLACYDRAGTIMDMVVCALHSGGSGAVMMSPQNAASWGYFDVATSQWHKEILEDIIPVQLLPEVVSVPSTAGHLMVDWHQIPRGTVISVAMGDLQCSVYAAQPSVSDAVLNIGSASQLALIKPFNTDDSVISSTEDASATPLNSLPQSVQEVPYFNGDHLLVAAALGGGNTVSVFVDTLRGWLRELGPHLEASVSFQDVYEKVMQSAMEKLDTSLRMDPRLWGERHDPDVRGSVGNIGPGNISLGDVGSAMVKGVVENLYTMMSPRLLQYYQVKRVLGSGQVIQRHAVFREHIQQVFNLPLVLKDEPDAPLGAAMAVAHL